MIPKFSLPKRSKFGNVKTTINGVTYDSKRELKHATLLSGVFPATIVHGTPIELQPKTDHIRSITYRPDFVVPHNGLEYVIDTKGQLTDVYKLKAKMAAYKGVYILEARTDGELIVIMNLIQQNLTPLEIWLKTKRKK